MRVTGLLSGGASVIKKYQVAQTTIAGTPLLASTSAEAGLDAPTTTAAADQVGITLDSATYTTAHTSGDPEAKISVVINPDAIIWMRFSGSGTSGTALDPVTVTTASTDGLAVTTAAFAWDNPEVDEGATWGYNGANAGQIRKITATSSTAATLTVALPYDTVVGDQFLVAPVWPMDLQSPGITLTSDFTEMDASVATATSSPTAAAYQCIEILHKDQGGDGTLTSGALFVSGDHVLGNRLT